jgi:hypothetical protein
MRNKEIFAPVEERRYIEIDMAHLADIEHTFNDFAQETGVSVEDITMEITEDEYTMSEVYLVTMREPNAKEIAERRKVAERSAALTKKLKEEREANERKMYDKLSKKYGPL